MDVSIYRQFDDVKRAALAAKALPASRWRIAVASLAVRRLEQFNRVAVGILNLNLFAAGADLHCISKMPTRLFQLSNALRQIVYLKDDTVPPAGLLLSLIGLSGTQTPPDR